MLRKRTSTLRVRGPSNYKVHLSLTMESDTSDGNKIKLKMPAWKPTRNSLETRPSNARGGGKIGIVLLVRTGAGAEHHRRLMIIGPSIAGFMMGRSFCVLHPHDFCARLLVLRNEPINIERVTRLLFSTYTSPGGIPRQSSAVNVSCFLRDEMFTDRYP